MIRRDTPGLRWVSIILAFLFMIMPLPAWLSSLRPFLLALVAVFWVLETPKKMGFGHLFIIGLLLDLTARRACPAFDVDCTSGWANPKSVSFLPSMATSADTARHFVCGFVAVNDHPIVRRSTAAFNRFLAVTGFGIPYLAMVIHAA